MDIRGGAEGVETREAYETLAEMGIHLFRGYRFARRGFEILPEPRMP